MSYTVTEMVIIVAGSFLAGAGAGAIVVLQVWRRHLSKCEDCQS